MMARFHLFSVLITLCFCGCHSSDKKEAPDKVLFVIHGDSGYHHPFYTLYNFILWNDTTVILHQQHDHYWFCGSNEIYRKSPPVVMLKPEHLQYIQPEELSSLLQTQLQPDNSHSKAMYGTFFISSPFDSIRNPAFKTILQIAHAAHIKTVVRRITPEEHYAVMAGKQRLDDIPDSIKQRIGTDINIRFEPPETASPESNLDDIDAYEMPADTFVE